MARLLIYIPEFHSDTALFFFSKGDSWKLRDYSTGRENVVSSNQVSKYTVDEIRSMALHEEEVRRISIKNVEKWKSEIERVNKYLTEKRIIKKGKSNSLPDDVTIPRDDMKVNIDFQILKDQIINNPRADKLKIDSLKLIDEIIKMDKIGEIDRELAVGKARKIIETIITDLANRFGGKKENLHETIKFLYRKQVIPKKINSLLNTIRIYGNLGLHYKPHEISNISLQDVKLIGMMSASIVEWYVTSEKP
jgi:hypothetical protein